MKDDKDTEKEKDTTNRLSEDDTKELIKWMKDYLGSKVTSIKESDRLVESPAIVVEHETAAFRRMVRFVDPQRTPELPKQNLEINPKHEIIKQLNSIRNDKPNLAKIVVDQIFDDALIAAGLLDDSRQMLPRINRLMATALHSPNDVEPLPVAPSSTKEKKAKEPKEPKEPKEAKEPKEPKEPKTPKSKKASKETEDTKKVEDKKTSKEESPKEEAPKEEAPKEKNESS